MRYPDGSLAHGDRAFQLILHKVLGPLRRAVTAATSPRGIQDVDPDQIVPGYSEVVDRVNQLRRKAKRNGGE